MEIKVEDYLSEEEIKEICKDALYQKIREDMRELNVNDIIAGISYAEVAAIKNRKKVRCDNTGEIYSSIRAASVATGISRANISNCAHGRYKQACGQHWSFV